MAWKNLQSASEGIDFMQNRLLRISVVLLLLGIAAGCGLQAGPSTASHSGHVKAPVRAAATSSTLVTPKHLKTTVLQPTSFLNITEGQTAATQTVNVALQNSASDTISLTTNPASGTGSLTVTDPSGQSLLTLPQVGGFSILQFGSAHPPVMITQAAGNLCGSDGCSYTAYTWSRQRRHFVKVPAPTTPSFQYNANKNQFIEVAATPPGGLFGFLFANANGINLDERLYDLWQHEEVLPYAYATNGSPGGQWVVAGAPEYTPKGPIPANYLNTNTPALALEALLEARSLDLESQGDMLLPGGSADQMLWNNLAAVSTWGPSLWVDTQNPQSTPGPNGSKKLTVIISGIHGNQPSAVLKAYRLTAEVSATGGSYVIDQAALAPMALKVRSVVDVLTVIRRNPQDRKYLTQHAGPLTVNAYGLNWAISVGNGSHAASWQVNAETGAITSAAPGT